MFRTKISTPSPKLLFVAVFSRFVHTCQWHLMTSNGKSNQPPNAFTEWSGRKSLGWGLCVFLVDPTKWGLAIRWCFVAPQIVHLWGKNWGGFGPFWILFEALPNIRLNRIGWILQRSFLSSPNLQQHIWISERFVHIPALQIRVEPWWNVFVSWMGILTEVARDATNEYHIHIPIGDDGFCWRTIFHWL